MISTELWTRFIFNWIVLKSRVDFYTLIYTPTKTTIYK